MKSFESGIAYLRSEALKSGFIQDSDNDDKLIERLSQVVRKLGPDAAEECDIMSANTTEGAEVLGENPVKASEEKPEE